MIGASEPTVHIRVRSRWWGRVLLVVAPSLMRRILRRFGARALIVELVDV